VEYGGGRIEEIENLTNNLKLMHLKKRRLK